MQKINIVMFNMSAYSDWQGGVSNRNYHLLKSLLADERVNKILAIDYLPWSFKQFCKHIFFGYWLMPFFQHDKILKRMFLANLFQINQNLYVFNAPLYYLSRPKFYQKLREMIKEIWSAEKYICWSCNPMETEYYAQLSANLYIFDAIDNWSLHPSYSKKIQLLKNNYKVIELKSDVIFAVANELQNIFATNNNVYWVPNGIDLHHYQNIRKITDRRIADLPRPIIGYIGVILNRLDWPIIEYLAQHNPKKSIVLVGSYKGRLQYWDRELIKKIKQYHNIHLLGFVTYQEAPSYICQFDVGIIPHRINTYVASTNPMKMYEYFACGKPIVATPAPGLNMFPDIALADNPIDFNDLVIRELLQDNSAAQEQRKKTITNHSWTERVNKMLNIIYERLN